jgi:hypothetical protein
VWVRGSQVYSSFRKHTFSSLEGGGGYTSIDILGIIFCLIIKWPDTDSCETFSLSVIVYRVLILGFEINIVLILGRTFSTFLA